MTTRQREKRLAHLRKLGRITPGMEWCLRTDRGRGMDRQYRADQIELPLNETLNLARMLGLVDAKTKAMMFKREVKAAMRSCKEARCKRARQIIEMRSTGASYRSIAAKFYPRPMRVFRICVAVKPDPLSRARGLIPDVEAVIRQRRAEGADWMAIAVEIGWSAPTTIRYGSLLGLPNRLPKSIVIAGQGTDPSQPCCIG